MGFTPCKAEQPLRGMVLKKKTYERIKATGNMFRKNLEIKGVC